MPHADSSGRHTTRRHFLTTTSCAIAGTLLGTRALEAGVPVFLPSGSPRPVQAFLPPTMPGPQLEALALRAVDAARSAGATYADVRVAERHLLEASTQGITLNTQLTYGVRALIDHAWGFAYGRSPTVDSVVRCAQDATASGRVAARLSGGGLAEDREWQPPPVATGEWRVPLQIDPFTVPVQQHQEGADALRMQLLRVPGTGGEVDSPLSVSWIRETRVVAATTGTCVTQQLHRVLPFGYFGGSMGMNAVRCAVPGLRWASTGYEMMLAPTLLDQVKAAAEESMRLAHLPMRPLDVGRYPIVLDGTMMGTMLGKILNPALELDRVLGGELDASGTSLLALDVLGQPVASARLTVRAHRALPSVTAVQWDDEGAVPREHPVIQEGVLVDYHTDGDTVSALAPWYRRHGWPLRSAGCAVAAQADNPVVVRAPHVVMMPGAARMSLGDLCAEMQRGVVSLQHGWISTDQQLVSGSISPWSPLFEVSRGRIVRRLKGVGLQFATRKFLGGLAALGDATTVRQADVRTSKGMPWVDGESGVTAPAALFTEIDVTSSRS